MTNKAKIKGTKWETDLVKLLAPHAEYVKRIPASGALGTVLGESNLTGAVRLKYKFLPKEFKIEAKTGYGGATQLTVRLGWMSKIREEAKNNGSYPAVSFKFKDVYSGDKESAKWICFTLEDWNGIVSYLNEVYSDLEEFWEWKYAKEKAGRIGQGDVLFSNNKEQGNRQDFKLLY